MQLASEIVIRQMPRLNKLKKSITKQVRIVTVIKTPL